MAAPHGDMEYVAGRLVDRHVGDYLHGRSQAVIGSFLGAREHTHRFRTFFSLTVRVSDEPRFRIPDICVKALPHEVTPVLVRPDLVIEIVSPDDELTEMLEKIGDYIAAGVPYVWVVDPYKRTLVEAGPAGIRRPATQVLATPLVGEVDFAALFEKLGQSPE